MRSERRKSRLRQSQSILSRVELGEFLGLDDAAVGGRDFSVRFVSRKGGRKENYLMTKRSPDC
jgi:hypothetical protein